MSPKTSNQSSNQSSSEPSSQSSTNATVFADLAASVTPLLVRIGRNARGSGLLVAPGKVLTNAHNLRNATVQITFADGTTQQGAVFAVDPDGDLAVITVESSVAESAAESTVEPGAGQSAYLPWADHEAQLGDEVYAIALTSSGPRVTRGNVSAVGRAFRGPRGRVIGGSIEHTAPIARGGSGTPIVNAQGQLLGVNTHRLGDGFYLALPGDAHVKETVTKLLAGASPRDLRLGVALARPEVAQQLRRSVGLADRDGLLVRAVHADSPAANAGIKEGDLLVSANAQALAVVGDLETVLREVAARVTNGAATEDSNVISVAIGIVRGSDELAVTVNFAP
jgi:serine protease Do